MNIFRRLSRPHRRHSRSHRRRRPVARRSITRASSSSRQRTPRSAISRRTPPWSSPRRRSRISPSPRELAVEIGYALAQSPDVAATEVAGPGFINIRLKPEVFTQVLRAVLRDPQNFGRVDKSRSSALQGKVNVEYVSANPTGPMHVGHGRGAVFGDALANLLAFSGCEVTREYYINDAGAQVDVLARSVYLRYREALGEAITIPEGLYPGDYLKPVGEALAKAHGKRARSTSRRASGCASFAPPPSTR